MRCLFRIRSEVRHLELLWNIMNHSQNEQQSGTYSMRKTRTNCEIKAWKERGGVSLSSHIPSHPHVLAVPNRFGGGDLELGRKAGEGLIVEGEGFPWIH